MICHDTAFETAGIGLERENAVFEVRRDFSADIAIRPQRPDLKDCSGTEGDLRSLFSQHERQFAPCFLNAHGFIVEAGFLILNIGQMDQENVAALVQRFVVA